MVRPDARGDRRPGVLVAPGGGALRRRGYVRQPELAGEACDSRVGLVVEQTQNRLGTIKAIVVATVRSN